MIWFGSGEVEGGVSGVFLDRNGRRGIRFREIFVVFGFDYIEFRLFVGYLIIIIL